MSAPVLRIAPTPSGYLHEGNLFNFVLNALWAKRLNGQLLLRIDDMDSDRVRHEYLADIFRWIDRLNITINKGPSGVEDFFKNWSQHTRMELYNHCLNDLKNTEHIFGCVCSRSQLAAHAGKPYPGTCETAGYPLDLPEMAWRLRVHPESVVVIRDKNGVISRNVGEETGSFVVRRKDGLPAYHLCSVADDLHFGVTHVVRGMDLLPSTAAQLYLADTLGERRFSEINWWHHPLMLGEGGLKISKSTLSSGNPLHETAPEVYSAFLRFMNIPSGRVDSFEALFDVFWSFY